ncbi:MAG: type I DNA topoisomerase [Alphaproteobacteria bacterium]|nr:type I DNA topoisomerase [Alphaproteobacteria bacterium]
MSHKLVIVESPAKAKTINKYLGADYTVLASYGHIRDLPPKDGSVRPDEDFAMDWELGDRADRPVSEITKAIKSADAVYLASDPDREGEAIAWHILEVLREKGLDKKATIKRVTFNEITKKTVTDAIANPREIDQDLVDAYMARRALDYLVGFSLSPVLWRKLPGAKSAGRVQSVALRLICERESEIEDFRAQEFWTIEATFLTANNLSVPAKLTHLSGKKLDKFALQTEGEAQAAMALLRQLTYKVASVEKKQSRRNPYPPFTTSTLQQEASRKLGMGATRTMRTAQNLYEGTDIGGETVGLITYMRTDGVTLSADAIAAAREVIAKDFGKDYVPAEARIYKTTAKNAQEAHEAIRPTDLERRPEIVAKYLDGEQLALYTLIWQRTMASQMASAVLDQVAVDIAGDTDKAVFRATGSVVVFDGWLKVYQESVDDDKKVDDDGYGNVRLPPVKENDPMKPKEIKPEQHFTQPPPRYSEASLVKRLEELGIGRPSTYASIMQVLQDRDYVKLDKKRFFPEDRGRIVTAFLENFFKDYVEYDFTADLETKLDDISGGKLPWKKVLREFWTGFSGAIGETKDLKISDVIDALDNMLGPHFFPPNADGSDPRQCQVCKTGRMGLKLGKFGAFLGCSNYPTCKNTRPLAVPNGADGTPQMAGPRELGTDPATGLPVSARVGPYGAYVQLGPPGAVAVAPLGAEQSRPDQNASAEPPPPPPEKVSEDGKKKKKKAKKKDDAPKPKRVSLPKGMDPNLIDLTAALKLLELPRDVGKHPESGEMITAGIGRFGPYIKMGPQYKSIPADDDVLNIGLNRAVVLLAEPSKGRFGAGATPGKLLGEHPEDKKPVSLNNGRFGPYIKWGKVMATVTKAYDPENVTMAQALEIIAAKIAKGPSKFVKGKKAKAEPEKKEAAPKKAAKPKKAKTKSDD